MRKNIGIQHFLNPRQDGATEYVITPELCDAYQRMESVQFEGVSVDDQISTLAMFGIEDELVNCRLEYLQYYKHYVMFACGYRLTREAIKNDLLPWVIDKHFTDCKSHSIKNIRTIKQPNEIADKSIFRLEKWKYTKLKNKNYVFANYMHHSEFYGHPVDQIRFKPGDVVEFYGCLGVICQVPRLYDKNISPLGDDSDDSYLVWHVDESAEKIELDKYGCPTLEHSHPMCTEVFEPHFPISQRMQRYIDNIRKFFNYPDMK